MHQGAYVGEIDERLGENEQSDFKILVQAKQYNVVGAGAAARRYNIQRTVAFIC